MQLQSGKSMLLEAAVLIYKLEDETLYAPWQVAASGFDRKTQRKDYDRLRLNLGEWSRYHNIRETFENKDENGDRAGRFACWYGKTWKEHLGYRDLEAAKRSIAKEKALEVASIEPKPIPISISPEEKTEKTSQKRKLTKFKPMFWVLPAAVLMLAFLLSSSFKESTQPLPLQEAKTEVNAPAKKSSANIEAVMAFSKARKLARMNRTPVRNARIIHPPIEELVWKMHIIDEPEFQSAANPNCVFFVSRTHQDMMPVLD